VAISSFPYCFSLFHRGFHTAGVGRFHG
jgi:hypothetical protein